MRARRTDANHTKIIDHFRRRWGFSVHVVNDVFDILVSRGGPSFCIEIKDGSKPPSARKLTQRAENFHTTYRGSVVVIKSIEEVDQFAQWAIRATDAVLNMECDR